MPPLTIPRAYSNLRPAAVSYRGQIAVVWKRAGNSTRLWWSTGRFEGRLGLLWDFHEILRGEADTDASPALVAIPRTPTLICAWKSVGESASVYFSIYNGSYWTPAARVLQSETHFAPSLAFFNGTAYLAWNGPDAALHLARWNDTAQNFQIEVLHDAHRILWSPAIAPGPAWDPIKRVRYPVLYAAFTESGSNQIVVTAFNGSSWQADSKLPNAFTESDVAICQTEAGVCVAWKSLEDQFPAAVTDPGATSQRIWYALVTDIFDTAPAIAADVYSNFSPALIWDSSGPGGEEVVAIWQTVYPMHPLAIGPLAAHSQYAPDGPYRPGIYGSVPAAAPSIYDAAQAPPTGDANWQTGAYAFTAAGELWAHREANNGPYDSKLIASGIDFPSSPLLASGTPTNNGVQLAAICQRNGSLQTFQQNGNDEWAWSEDVRWIMPPGATITGFPDFSAVNNFYFGVDATGALVKYSPDFDTPMVFAMTRPLFAPPGAPLTIGYRSDVVPSGIEGSGPLNVFLVGNDGALWAFDIEGNGIQLPGYVALLPGSHVACGYQTAVEQLFLAHNDTGQSQLNVFVIDENGQLQTWWESQGSAWIQTTMAVASDGLTPGGHLGIGGQLYSQIPNIGAEDGSAPYAEADQLDVITVDASGSLRVWYVYQSTNWDFIQISPSPSYIPGSPICTTAQSINHDGTPLQLTLFIVDPHGRIITHWVYESGSWENLPLPSP